MISKGIGLSDLGKERKNNEDAFFVDDELGLYIVCDGMGGHACGEVASALAVETARNWISEHKDILSEMRSGEGSPERTTELAKEAVRSACRAVYSKAMDDETHAGMGTTMTLLLVLDGIGIMAHVGDTRLYLSHNDSIFQLSTDHTIAAEFLRSKLLSEEEVKNSPFANSLTRTVGPQEMVMVDSLVFDIPDGSRLLLCSDGFSGYLDSIEELNDLMKGDVTEIPKTLINHANAAGGHDNITVVAIETLRDDASETDASSVVELLGGVFPFDSMRRADVQRVRNLCETVSVSAGDKVFHEEDEVPGMIIVTSGEFWLERSGKRVRKLAAGEAIGSASLLSSISLDLSLEAIGDSEFLLLKQEPFLILCNSKPWLGMTITRKLGEKLCALSEEAILSQL